MYNDELNTLEFNYEDLFVKSKNDDTYYFQIVFKSGYYNWLLGRPLFKKYHMVFEQKKKIFGFYKEDTMKKESEITFEGFDSLLKKMLEKNKDDKRYS